MRTTKKILPAKAELSQSLWTEMSNNRVTTWRTPLAAAVLSLVMGLSSMDVYALALGRVTVLSALGEPLRAEIDVPDINADEAASLRAGVAGTDAFKAAGLEYNPALGNLQVTLQKRANGQSYLRLSGDKPINDPFVDLILEANWASGRITRDYTLLFDPPNLRQAVAPTTAPNVASGGAPATAAPRAVAVAPTAPAAVAVAAPRAAPVAKTPAPAPRKPVAPSTPTASDAAGKQVTVKAGDTAGAIAARNKPQGVSLDQMLVAMLRSNPDAFMAGNINRLKSGAVLDLPNASQAGNTPEGEARQTIVAQSKDFNDFRRRLAEGAPAAAAPAADRKASGTVQANVQERKPAASAPDKLTLSKGAVGAASTAQAEAIAKEKQAKETAARAAELSKNIQDLNKLGTTTASTTASTNTAANKPSGSASASAAGVPVAITAPASAAKPVASAAAAVASAVTAAQTAASALKPAVSTTVAASTTTAATPATPSPTTSMASPSVTTSSVATASATVTVASPAAIAASATAIAKTAPVPMPEPSLVDELLDNPVTLPAAGGLLALLAGFGIYRTRQRKKSPAVDSSFLESRLQPDSFFGASGGQRVDTNDAQGAGTASSMVYSPSQLDAAGDVDPVAEADVYLAYGRDLQAEEILKEAMRTNPTRVAIHAKLMEIYAKRRDTKAFESVAHEAHTITRGEGPDWEAACALGRELDPGNGLYQPGGRASSSNSITSTALAAGAASAAAASAFGASTITQPVKSDLQDNSDLDFALDMDFSLSESPYAEPVVPRTQPDPYASAPAALSKPAHLEPDLDFDFGTDTLTPPSASIPTGTVDVSSADFASFSNSLSASVQPVPRALQPTVPVSLGSMSGAASAQPMNFDMGDLSLDLGPTTASPELTQGGSDSSNPLDTKFALALEFREIGDPDGARLLAQEVAEVATGALKAKAQKLVSELS